MPLSEMPDWRRVLDVEDFVLAVRDALKAWLLMHTDAECWAEEWTAGEPEWSFKNTKGRIDNDWFSFDWKAAVYREMAEDWLPTTERCPRCGMLVFEGWEIDCDCWEDDEEPESEPCTDDDLDELVEWMEDTCTEPDPDVAYRALVTHGFTVYQDALASIIDGYVDEMRDAVDALNEAISDDDRWAMLTLAREATRIYHVNGEVMEDYGERVGLEFRLVDRVRDEGYAEVFGRDEVREFLGED
jgi:hypothetical protein